MTTRKRLRLYTVVILLILAIPLIAMPFSSEVKWEISDFIVAAILLTGTAIAIEIALQVLKTPKQRVATIAILLIILILLWAEMAVGLFNSPIAGT